MHKKRIPMRMCTGCGEMKPKAARKSRRFERAFSCQIPAEVYDKMEEEISKYESE